MRRIDLHLEPFPEKELRKLLEENRIRTNPYAEAFFAHPGFPAKEPRDLTIAIASLQEIGLQDGATLEELFRYLPGTGFRPCPPCTGLFLRLAWTDQPRSRNSVLTGTHQAPDQAVTVLSEFLETEDSFPKGLYLRHVDGDLWLRGYVCDGTYRFPGDSLFAVEAVRD